MRSGSSHRQFVSAAMPYEPAAVAADPNEREATLSAAFSVTRSPTEPTHPAVCQVLMESYRAKKYLSVPLASQTSPRFPISESYVDLTLVRNAPSVLTSAGTEPHEGIETSLANEETFYKDKTLLDPIQLFVPLAGEAGPINRILVTGRAGIGKSTLCHYIAYQWANPEARLFNDQFHYVFWLSLASLKSKENKHVKTIAEWIKNEWFANNNILTLDVLEAVLHHQTNNCLLLLDGFDEAKDLFGTRRVLKEACEFPHVVVTSRPYQVDPSIVFDRHLENVGFTDRSIQHYIRYFFSKDQATGRELQQYIDDHPILTRVCRIPLNLSLLCGLRQQRLLKMIKQTGGQRGLDSELDGSLTITGIYQKFTREFLIIGASKCHGQAEASVRDWSSKTLKDTFAKEIASLSKLAFITLHNKDPYIPKKQVDECNSTGSLQHLFNTGFLRRVSEVASEDQECYFVHKTFQEYFAALYLLNCLHPYKKGTDEFNAAIQFIREHKYNISFSVVMYFLAGLASDQTVPDKTVNYIWDALLTTDQDWVGLRHIELVMRALEEGFIDNRIPHRQQLINDSASWLLASIQEGDDPFKQTIRQRLSDTLLLCLRVAASCFDQLIKKWPALPITSKSIALRYYVVPLISTLSQAATFFISMLGNQDELKHYQSILSSVQWGKLKNTTMRIKIQDALLALLKGEASTILFAISPLSELLDKENTQAVNQLQRLLDHPDAWVKIHVAITLEKVTEKRQASVQENVLRCLKDKEEEIRYQALLAAAKMLDVRAYKEVTVEAIYERLEDESARISELAVSLLTLEIRDQEGEKATILRQRLWTSLQRRYQAKSRVKKLLEMLKSSTTASFRASAAGVLGQLGQASDEVIQGLLTALKDVDKDVRFKAVYALGQLGRASDEVIQGLLAVLKDANERVRSSAAVVLGQLGRTSDEVIQGLLAALKDSDRNVCGDAVLALGQLGRASDEVIQGLLAALKDSDRNVWGDAVLALGQLGRASDEVIEVLLAALKDSDEYVRSRAADALGQSGRASDKVSQALLAVLKYSEWTVRSFAVIALGQSGRASDEVIQGLLAVLKDSDRNVRGHAVLALGQLGRASDEVIEGLLAALKDHDKYVRSRAADALGQLGRASDEVSQGLVGALQDSEVNVNLGAADALGQLGRASGEVIQSLVEALKDADEGVRGFAAKALGQSGRASDEVIQGLLVALKDANGGVRGYAAKALGQSGRASDEVIQGLVEALQDFEGYVRSLAAKALGQLGRASGEVIEGLLAVLKDSERYVRSGAADALGQLGRASDEVIQGLLAGLKDADSSVRSSAAGALGQLDQVTHRVMQALLTMLRRFDKDDHLRAVRALGDMKKITQTSFDVLMAFIENATDQNTYAILVESISCLEITKQSYSEVKDNNLVLSLDKLSSSDHLTQQEAMQELIALKKDSSTKLINDLLSLLIAQPERLPGIVAVILTLQFSTNELLMVIATFEQISIHGELVLQPLVEVMLREGVAINSCTSSNLVLYDNEGKHAVPIAFGKSVMIMLLKIMRDRMAKSSLPVDVYDAIVAAQRPRYLQRGSFSFFQAPQIQLWGVIPLLTHNHAIAMRTSQSIYPHIDSIFSRSVANEEDSFTTFVNKEQQAIKIKLNQKHPGFCNAVFLLDTIFTRHIRGEQWQYLDLSGNQLDDSVARYLVLFLRQFHTLRILRLSFNCVTQTGLKPLLKIPSLKYLLFDHNHIDCNTYFCDELINGLQDPSHTIPSLIEQSGLIHLDLSMNYVVRSSLSDDHKLSRGQALLDAGADDSSLRLIRSSYVVHSGNEAAYHIPVRSILDVDKHCIGPDDYIKPDIIKPDIPKMPGRGAVALFAAKKKGLLNEHAFLVIEDYDTEMGQKRIIRADLLVNKTNNRIEIHVSQISPESFLAKMKEYDEVRYQIAYKDSDAIMTLLRAIYTSIDDKDCYKYKALPGKKAGILNCYKWAAEMLKEIGIKNECDTCIPMTEMGSSSVISRLFSFGASLR